MAEERFKLYGAVFLILHRDNKILLSKRRNTGWQDGNYGLVSGHIEPNESFIGALCREAKEEADIIITPEATHFVQALHRIDGTDGREYIDIGFTVESWEGEITNNEPDKCEELRWFDIDNLPVNIIPSVKYLLDCYRDGTLYSEFGWPKNKV